MTIIREWGIILWPQRINFRGVMDKEENDDTVGSRRNQPASLDWIYLALPLTIAVLGVGILTGLFFRSNPLFAGSMKYIIGGILTLYGAARCVIISRKLKGPKKA